MAGARLGAAAPAGVCGAPRRLSHALPRSRHARAVDRRGLRRCRAAGVEPLLAKGWAVARLYPEPGLRPYGDIDLFVRPEEYSAAETALAGFRPRRLLLDLQRGFPDLADHPLQEVFAHSQVAECGGVQVRIVGPEDQLRHLCVHLLRHGAWRPLWLCDVAAAVESVDVTFDWDYCLRGKRQRTQAVICAIGLAHQLLGARIEHTPLADRARRLPRWLVPAVLRQWGVRHELDDSHGGQAAASGRDPASASAALAESCRNDHVPSCPLQRFTAPAVPAHRVRASICVVLIPPSWLLAAAIIWSPDC